MSLSSSVPRRAVALATAACLAAAGLATTSVAVDAPATAEAATADAPWTLPTVPPRCTAEQRASGDVAGCVITLGAGNPEDRGWPAPPFPEPVEGEVIPWVDLAKGSSGPIVSAVQERLNANGARLTVDGQFGSLTESAVKTFQSARALPATGVVDATTASRLGVENTTFSFPPPGWNWLGWGYNGSPALAQWEQQMVTNPTQIGAVKAGSFRSLPDVLPLFTGFLAEIQTKGYVISGGAGAYVFRCTATTRKDCSGLTRSSLSNHAYGLATDFNTMANPLKSYYGIDGRSACQTPMQTDIPRWVVQVAEKWGLYWGGYGWSSGCSSPTQYKTSAMRDPMHFEFNGTPDEARAILRFNLGDSVSCLDVVSDSGVMGEHCLPRGDAPPAGTRVVVETGAPQGATAALVNIATVDAASDGYITAEDCAARSGLRAWANGTVRPGRATSSATVVPLDADGRFCIYQSTRVHTVVDVQGWFAPSAAAPDGNLFTPVRGQRVVDTRVQATCSPDGTCREPGSLPANAEVLGLAASPTEVVATVANLTAVNPSAPGYLSADVCADLVPGPQEFSSLNFNAGDTIANLSFVPSVSTEVGVQFCTTAIAPMHKVIDVQGFFGPAAQGGLGFTAQRPSRLVDTRLCRTDPVNGAKRCGEANPAGAVLRLSAPAGAAAVMVNLAAVSPATDGYATAGSCTDIRPEPQSTASVVAVPGTAVTNGALVPVAPDGTFCVYTSTAMHLVVDLLGVYSERADLRFVPVSPGRVHDTRLPG